MKRLYPIICLVMALCLMFAGCAKVPASSQSTLPESSSQASEAVSAYPKEDIILYCQFSAGGGNDVQLRAITPYIQKYLPNSVNVVADNKTGGGGIVCSNYVYASKPDGYTLMQAQMGTMLVQQQYSKEIAFDCNDFTWLGIYAFDTSVLVVRPELGITTWNELAAYSEKNTLNMGTAGVGSNTHTQAALFVEATDIKANLVHYSDGTSAVIAAMSRGEVDAYIFSLGNQSIAAEKNGSVTTLCVLADKRSEFIPETPTLAEIGCPSELVENVMKNPITSAPRGFCAPKGLPQDVTDVLDKAITAAMNDEELRAWAKTNMLTWTPMNAAETQKWVSDSLENLAPYKELLNTIMG